MRRIISMIQEFALEHHKDNNERVEELREAYQFIDRALDGDYSMTSTRLREALVTADFPLYFGRVISAGVEKRYQYRRGQWRDYCKITELPNYLTAERYRFSEFDTLHRRREKQEARAGYIFESRYQLRVYDWAKQIDFSHQILVNDDLGAFEDIILKMGDSAARFEDYYVSSLYDNPTTQTSLISLGANYAGTGRLTTANLITAITAFAQRTDARGNPLNIVPKYLVIPPVLRPTANAILESERIAELATNSINPVRVYGLQIREDPYIAFSAPNIPWYLFADPNDVPTVTVTRLASKGDKPYVYTKAPDKAPLSATGAMGVPDWRTGSFLTGDIELLVEDTIGSRSDSPNVWVGVTDYYGIYYSSGTAP